MLTTADILDVANIMGQIFCIGILFVLDTGMLIPEKSYESKKFQQLVVADALYVLLNIAWQVVEGRTFPYCIEIHYIIYAFISATLAYLGICYYQYLFYVITRKYQKSFLIAIPGIILTSLSASSYWTGLFYSVDENNNFILKPEYTIHVVLVYFYLLLIASVSFVKWKKSSSNSTRKRASISSSLVIPPIITVILYLLFPKIICLHSFGITLSIASVFVRLQKQEVTSTMQHTEIVKENAILYRNTVLSKALQFMVINLTSNKVEELIIPKRPDMTVRELIQQGVLKSSNYIHIVEIWRQSIIDLSTEEFYAMFDSDYLKSKFESGDNKVSNTYRVLKKNGEISWCNQDIIMAKNKKTQDIIATITVTDITEQKKQEQLNSEQQAIIEALAYGSPSYWIVDIDTEEFIEYKIDNDRHSNIIAQDGLGDTYTEFINRVYDHMVINKTQKDLLMNITIDTVRNKLSENMQYIVPFNLYYEKENVYFQLSYTRLDLSGRKAFILSTRDITENVEREKYLRDEITKALEKAEKASEAKSSFLFNMSHDIRTPMNAILGFNDMAVKHIDDKDKALDALYKAKISGEHMLSIINDILDIARIESGKMKLNIDVMDVKDSFSKFDDMFSLAMKQKGVDFKIINNTKTQYVYADYLRISQVVSNLLSNAMKFTNPGGTVTVTANEHKVDREDYVGFELLIKDTGIGMSEEFQKKIFQNFERENSATVSGVQGTGLGLAIAKNFVELMGGTISFKSKLGEGTEFRIYFDSKIAENPNAQKDDKQASNTDFTGVKVLVVEDNELNREIVCDILEDEGFVITSAENGKKAVELVMESPSDAFDIILMDVQMPVMDGYTATKEIRAMSDPKKNTLPVIAMTANAFDDDKKQALSIGMNEHITKPIDVERMLGIIAKFI